MQRPASEKSVRQLLKKDFNPRLPLKDRLKDLQVPVAFLFGDMDRIYTPIVEEAISKGILMGGSVVYTVENAGHHLYSDSPHDCITGILAFTHG